MTVIQGFLTGSNFAPEGTFAGGVELATGMSWIEARDAAKYLSSAKIAPSTTKNSPVRNFNGADIEKPNLTDIKRKEMGVSKEMPVVWE